MEDIFLNQDFWRGKRVFLTGHTGFKGSWLSLWLQNLGADVTGFSLAPLTEPSMFDQANVASGLTSIEGDIRDRQHVRSALAESDPEIVIHMAAQSLVRRSFTDPIDTFETNVVGTAHLLQAMQEAPNVSVGLIVTSDKCYENRGDGRPHVETDPLGGGDPYSSSKACAEFVTTAYRQAFFKNGGSSAVATARAGNVIGGGDWAEDRLVPDLMRAALSQKPALIRNPTSTRPWQHVLDCLYGYLLLVERLWGDRDYIGAWNFGPSPNVGRPVSWIIDQLTRLWPEPLEWTIDPSVHPPEAPALQLDSSKARAGLAWEPQMTLEASLESVVAWCLAYRDGKDLHDESLQQIQTFESLVGRERR